MFCVFPGTSNGGHRFGPFGAWRGNRRGWRFGRGLGGRGRFPAGWEQDSEVVLVGHGREALEKFGAIGFRIVTVLRCWRAAERQGDRMSGLVFTYPALIRSIAAATSAMRNRTALPSLRYGIRPDMRHE